MAYPSLTFAALLENTPRQELEQLVSLLQGYLSAQHDENGAHTDITADSVTVTGDVTVDGDGTFDGNVTADADGQPAVLGNLGAGLGTGLDLTNGASSRWSIVALTAAVTRVLQIRDVLNPTQTYVAQFGSYASGTGLVNYSLVPETNTGITLGEDSIGKRLDQVNTRTLIAATQASGAQFIPTTFGLTGRPVLAQITANQNDYAIGSGRAYISSDAARDITGLVAGFEGEFLWIVNFGAFNITLKYNSASSAAANRILCANATDVVLRPGAGSALLHYDTVSTFWYVLGA